MPPRAGSIQEPLYAVLAKIAALWALANAGYYILFPAFGIQLSYNSAPIAIALYFLLWAVVSFITFRGLFGRYFLVYHRVLLYGALSLGFVALAWGLLYAFSLLPALQGPLLAPYSDILFATPWYFLPKSVEILVQQLLIAVLVLELSSRLHSFKQVVIGYAICFGGAHVLLFLLNRTPTPYATMMTAGAVLSAFIFPHLMLRVRGGFMYAYMLHVAFYIILATLLHVWPPSGYGI